MRRHRREAREGARGRHSLPDAIATDVAVYGVKGSVRCRMKEIQDKMRVGEGDAFSFV